MNETSVYCGGCGAEIPASVKFCIACGASQSPYIEASDSEPNHSTGEYRLDELKVASEPKGAGVPENPPEGEPLPLPPPEGEPLPLPPPQPDDHEDSAPSWNMPPSGAFEVTEGGAPAPHFSDSNYDTHRLAMNPPKDPRLTAGMLLGYVCAILVPIAGVIIGALNFNRNVHGPRILVVGIVVMLLSILVTVILVVAAANAVPDFSTTDF